MSTPSRNSTVKWKGCEDYPFETKYNDHFETPLEAYRDLVSMLEWIKTTTIEKDSDRSLTLYDPYYCNGRTKVLLQELGFEDVVHEKRDFYNDVESKQVPEHHVLITNPPYSDEHKDKCLKHCFESDKPWFLLMPNYAASRNYFRGGLVDQHGSKHHHILYLVPNDTYQFEHPEGTGHAQSPFASLWFCGLPKNKFSTEVVNAFLSKRIGEPSTIFPAWSTMALHQGLVVKRPNPKQRRKQKAAKQAQSTIDSTEDSAPKEEQRTKQDAGGGRKRSKSRGGAGSRRKKQR